MKIRGSLSRRRKQNRGKKTPLWNSSLRYLVRPKNYTLFKDKKIEELDFYHFFFVIFDYQIHFLRFFWFLQILKKYFFDLEKKILKIFNYWMAPCWWTWGRTLAGAFLKFLKFHQNSQKFFLGVKKLYSLAIIKNFVFFQKLHICIAFRFFFQPTHAFIPLLAVSEWLDKFL